MSVKGKKSRPARIRGCVFAAAALSGCNAAPLDSAADDRSDRADSALAVGSLNNPGVVPPDGLVDNMSLAQWSAIWWQQILATPFKPNPVFDTTGKHCAKGAHGDVWFLAGTTGVVPPVTRTCTIPTDTFIFFPLVSTADDNNNCPPPNQLDCSRFPTLEDCLTDNAHMILQATTLSAVVDGVPLNNLFDYVQTSKLFFFTGKRSLIEPFDPCIIDHGRAQEAVAYGWWLMLEPLTPGDHTLKFRSTGTFGGGPFDIDVTYHLQIGH